MKVVFVLQPWARAFPPSESVVIWTRQVARRLARRREVSQVVVYGQRYDPSERLRCDDGVEYRFLSLAHDYRLLRALRPLSPLRRSRRPMFASPLSYPGFALQVAADLRRLRPDIVHVHNFSQFVFPMSAAVPEARIALHMHCEWLSELDAAMVRRRLARTAAVFAPSDHVTDKVRLRFPELASRCHTLVNGVDIEEFAPASGPGSPRPPRLLVVGRISPDKGIHVIFEAFERVLRVFPEARLELVGEEALVPMEMMAATGNPALGDLRRFYVGSYRAVLERSLPESARDQVEFSGFVPHPQVVAHFQRADVVLSASFEEAFGMPLVEAMAAGVPVVVTRAGGKAEVVSDGETGLLTPPGDPVALADAVVELLADRERAGAMARAARARAVDRYRWERVADDVWQHYRDMTESGGQPERAKIS